MCYDVLCLYDSYSYIINKMVVRINGCRISQWRMDSRQNLFAIGPQSGWTSLWSLEHIMAL